MRVENKHTQTHNQIKTNNKPPQSTSTEEFSEETPCKISAIATVHPNVSNNPLSVQAAQTWAGGKELGSLSNSPKCTHIHMCVCLKLCRPKNSICYSSRGQKPNHRPNSVFIVAHIITHHSVIYPILRKPQGTVQLKEYQASPEFWHVTRWLNRLQTMLH